MGFLGSCVTGIQVLQSLSVRRTELKGRHERSELSTSVDAYRKSEVQAEQHEDLEIESEISVDAVVAEIELNSNSKTLATVTTDITDETAGTAETEGKSNLIGAPMGVTVSEIQMPDVEDSSRVHIRS